MPIQLRRSLLTSVRLYRANERTSEPYSGIVVLLLVGSFYWNSTASDGGNGEKENIHIEAFG